MDNGFTREDYDETARAIRLRINDPELYADGIYPVMSNRVNVILGALDCASHLMRMREEWIAERERAIAEHAACHALLDTSGMPFEDHGEERPLTLLERVECIVAEYVSESGHEHCDLDNAYRRGYFQCREDMKAATRQRLRVNQPRGLSAGISADAEMPSTTKADP